MNSDEYSYGWNGGQRYLEEMMALKNNQSDSLKELRLALNSTFSKINCFLMPHPGLKVAKGNFVPSDIVPDFVRNLNEFAAHVFSPNNLQVKKIGGKPVNGRKMMEYFKYFLDSFKDKERLRPETIHEATCRANYAISMGETQLSFTRYMSEKCTNTIKSIEPNALGQFFVELKNKTIEMFVDNNWIKCENMFQIYSYNLENWMKEQFEKCRLNNYVKRTNELNKSLENSIREKHELQTSFDENMQQLRDIKKQMDGLREENTNLEIQLNTANNKLNNSIQTLQETDSKLENCINYKHSCDIDRDNDREIHKKEIALHEKQFEISKSEKLVCINDKENCLSYLSDCNSRISLCKSQKEICEQSLSESKVNQNKCINEKTNCNTKINE
jgi:hypothetical protein